MTIKYFYHRDRSPDSISESDFTSIIAHLVHQCTRGIPHSLDFFFAAKLSIPNGQKELKIRNRRQMLFNVLPRKRESSHRPARGIGIWKSHSLFIFPESGTSQLSSGYSSKRYKGPDKWRYCQKDESRIELHISIAPR